MAEDVLIIEAEQPVAQSIAQSLAERSWPSRTTADGKEGLELAQKVRPAAIVLCAELPKMSGYSICAKLKKDPNLKAVPLVFTSAEASESTFEHHKKLKVRADEYMNKPFEMGQLMEVLGRHISLDAPAITEEEPVDLDDLSIEADAPVDAGGDFDVDQAIAVAADSLDSALEAISEGDGSRIDLSSGVGVPVSMDEDEALTTVGAPPEHVDGADALRRRIAELEERLERESGARRAAEAASSQIPSSASQPPSAASRELYNLKKELNHKDHEILELRDRLHSKDKEMLTLRDREMELEGRIVQAEEERDQEHSKRTEVEHRLQQAEGEREDARRQVAELGDQLQEAEQRIGQMSDEKGRLESVHSEQRERIESLERAQKDLEDTERRLEEDKAQLSNEVAELKDRQASAERERNELREAKGALEDQVRDLEAQRRDLEDRLSAQRSENEQLAHDKRSVEAELEELRGRFADLERQHHSLEEAHRGQGLELESTRSELEGVQQRLSEVEERAEREQKRRGDTEESASKARHAIEIALKMLQEIEEVDNGAPEAAASQDALHP